MRPRALLILFFGLLILICPCAIAKGPNGNPGPGNPPGPPRATPELDPGSLSMLATMGYLGYQTYRAKLGQKRR